MLGICLDNVRKTVPLVHNITNYVTVNDVANTIESEPFADWPWVRIYCFVRRPGIIFPAAA